MAASYPTAIASLPARSDGAPFVASYINALQDEVAALEASFIGGALPSPLRLSGSPLGGVIFDGGTTQGLGRILAASHQLRVSQNLESNAASTDWVLDDPASPGVHLVLDSSGIAINDRLPTRGLTSLVYFDGATGGIREKGRSFGMGEWQDVSASAQLSAASGTWTVSPANIKYSYMVVGRVCFFSFCVGPSTLSTTPAWIRVTLPFGNLYAQQVPCNCYQGGWQSGQAVISGNVLTIYATVSASVPWAAGANTYVTLQTFYPIP
jgi:hypothetical protein